MPASYMSLFGFLEAQVTDLVGGDVLDDLISVQAAGSGAPALNPSRVQS